MQPPAPRAAFYYPRMTRNDDHEQDDDGRVRLDKWLWAARFFKTRALAAEAVTGGKVTMHGDRVKPARPVQAGDEISIRLGPYEHIVRVRELSARRGPATVAATLYEETPESLAARTKLAEQLRLAPAVLSYEEKGRPTKRDRREIDKWRKR
jgi:ribosome-associated heat shock protein Hsp15